MFKLASKRVVWWPVDVHQPRDDGSGEVDTFSIKVQFELLSTEEMRRSRLGTYEEDVALLKQKARGWENVGDGDGNPIPFSAAALEQALDVPYFRGALVLALIDASSGRAASKNSSRGSAGS